MLAKHWRGAYLCILGICSAGTGYTTKQSDRARWGEILATDKIYFSQEPEQEPPPPPGGDMIK